MRGAILTTVLLSVALAQVAAAAPRTFVRSTGSDVNPCSLASPCRNFAAAIAAVDAGGEVIVLDSAGYGVFPIHKAGAVFSPAGGVARPSPRAPGPPTPPPPGAVPLGPPA